MLNDSEDRIIKRAPQILNWKSSQTTTTTKIAFPGCKSHTSSLTLHYILYCSLLLLLLACLNTKKNLPKWNKTIFLFSSLSTLLVVFSFFFSFFSSRFLLVIFMRIFIVWVSRVRNNYEYRAIISSGKCNCLYYKLKIYIFSRRLLLLIKFLSLSLSHFDKHKRRIFIKK